MLQLITVTSTWQGRAPAESVDHQSSAVRANTICSENFAIVSPRSNTEDQAQSRVPICDRVVSVGDTVLLCQGPCNGQQGTRWLSRRLTTVGIS